MKTIKSLPRYAAVASSIVAKFGGDIKVARLLGIRQSTVASWKKTGVIPEKYRWDLLRAAKSLGVPHTAIDYVAYLITAEQ